MENSWRVLYSFSWLDYLILAATSFFMLTYDVLTIKYISNGVSQLNIPELYGFPFPNKTNYHWCDDGERLIYIVPFFIDYLFYFLLISILYWFVFIVTFQIKLRKKIFLPLFFGILFVALVPYIAPLQEYTISLSEFPSGWYSWHINWFGSHES